MTIVRKPAIRSFFLLVRKKIGWFFFCLIFLAPAWLLSRAELELKKSNSGILMTRDKFQKLNRMRNESSRVKAKSGLKSSNFNFMDNETLHPNSCKYNTIVFVIAVWNNTETNFPWKLEKTNFKVLRNCEITGKISSVSTR